MKLSIIIPAHNEEHRLPPVLRAYADFFEDKLGEAVEILVVVNGSMDRTVGVCESIAKDSNCIKVLEEPRRIGKGGAVVLGVQQAAGDYVGFVDADGATAPEEFFRLYQKTIGRPGVIASRWMKGADVTIPQRALRMLSSRLFNLLTRLLLGLKYKDTQCGAKIFRAEAWQAILPDIGTTRFAFDVDLLFQLKRRGYAVSEEPTVWRDIEGSKVRVFNSSAEMFFAVVRMRLLFSPFRILVRWYDMTLSRPFEFLLADKLFRHTVLLFGASLVTTVCNVGYQMVVGRNLPPADYALLATFLALFAILARPLATVSTAINRYASLLESEGHIGVIRRLLLKWIGVTGIISILLAVACGLFASQIASFFHLDRVAPVMVSAIALPVIFITPVVGGMLQGLQRFAWSSLSAIIGALGRVLFGAVFVVLIYPACGWALAGHVGGMYLTLLVGICALLPLVFKTKPDRAALPSLRLYMLQCFLFQIGAAVLMTGDVVMVKHYLPREVGFAYAATLGRMVAFMSAAVALAMFPKVTSEQEFTETHRRLYVRSQLYSTVFISASLLICFIFPAFLLRFLFRISEPGSDLLSLTRWMGLVMALATLLNINVNLLLAQRRFRLLLYVLGAAIFYLAAVFFHHPSAYWVVFYAGLANGAALVLTTVGIMKSPSPPSQ